jgi:error-prone DNA polymerase
VSGYAELGALSCFTFLEGASHPHELAAQAMALGHAAIGIADRNSFAGLVRGHVAAKEARFRFVPGVRIRLPDEGGGGEYLAWPTDRAAYGRLSRLLSKGRMEAPKGECRITRDDLIAHAEGLVMALLPPAAPDWPAVREAHGPAPAHDGRGVSSARQACDASSTREDRDTSVARRGHDTGCARPERDAPSADQRHDTVRRMRDPLSAHPERGASSVRRCGIALVAHQEQDGPCTHEERDASSMRRSGPVLAAHRERDALRTRQGRDGFAARLARDAAALRPHLALPLFCAADHRFRGDDRERLALLAAMAAAARAPLLAAGGARFHAPERRRLADVMAAIRLRTTVDALGFAAAPNAEAHLKAEAEMRRLFAGHEAAVDATMRVVHACRFSMADLSYEYPDEILDEGLSPQETLARRAETAMRGRWPEGVPEKVRAQVAHELRLIGQLGYAPYFLTVHEIVRFAQAKGILCQGRGSAANSALCYALGITSVPPDKHDLLFERFISAERDEPPDIDVDFEHERREEVIQHIYGRYGRDRAAIAATVIRYRDRSAIREVGRAMGLTEDVTAGMAKGVWGVEHKSLAEVAAERGLDPAGDPRLRMACELAEELIGFPRHLATHVGGFVITRGKLTELAIVTRAAMADRHTIEWDKDDIDALRILKVDVLGLGMLTCVHRAFALIEAHGGGRWTLQSVPQDDPETYRMLRRADSVGVFQVESRAQMNMLPRLRPEKFYDLVVEVAIVRPGPIQGDMVHPYLRRKSGEEEVSYPSDALRGVLEKTLGVPLFQEQAMRIAIVGAGFPPERADRLRRAMATFRHVGTVHGFREEFVAGMRGNGYPQDFAERCFSQIEGFGTYGFPESHAAAFAQLVYVSAWIKRHHPAAFAAAILNSQPMGFYAPAQLVRDAREHGVRVRPVDALRSGWDCTLEPDAESDGGLALRLGFRMVLGFRQDAAERLVAARPMAAEDASRGAGGLTRLARRAGLDRAALERLAGADAFRSLGLDRRAALWAAAAVEAEAALPAEIGSEPAALLPTATAGEQTVLDYTGTGLSLRHHPLALLRPLLDAEGLADTRALAAARRGVRLRLPGLVLVRQRPGSAKGVVFFTVEDEWGVANLVVYADRVQRFRAAVVSARLVVAEGTVERTEAEVPILHLIVQRLVDRSELLSGLSALDRPGSREPWKRTLARADEVEKGDARDHRTLRLPRSRDFH